jgi:hypothetical protein
MSAVVSFVSDVVEGAADIVGDVVEGVGDIVEDVGDAIGDAGSWIDDNVLQPMLDDPVKTVATVAAIATGQPQLIPYINAASVAAKGGDLEDIGKAYVVSTVAQGAGKMAAAEVAKLAAPAAVAAEYGIDAAGQQAAMLAAQEAGFNTATNVAASTAGGAVGGATSALLTGGDPLTAAVMGGTSGAIGAGTRAGIEKTFGTEAVTSPIGRVGTAVATDVAKQAILPTVAEAIIDRPDRPTPQRSGSGTGQQTPAAGTGELAGSNYELKKYINDEGGVLYINFKDGEPQQTIPPGYREEKIGDINVASSTTPQLEPTTPYEMPAAKGGLASKKRKTVVKSKKGLAVKKK